MTQQSGSFYHFLDVRKEHDCGRKKANQTETKCLKGTGKSFLPICSNACVSACARTHTHTHTHTLTHIHKAVLCSFFLWALDFSSPSKSSFLFHEGWPVLQLDSLFLLAEDWEFRRPFSFWTVSVPLRVSVKYCGFYKHQIIISYIKVTFSNIRETGPSLIWVVNVCVVLLVAL